MFGDFSQFGKGLDTLSQKFDTIIALLAQIRDSNARILENQERIIKYRFKEEIRHG
jgi:hypothetical protein